jgi:hypothetical protein
MSALDKLHVPQAFHLVCKVSCATVVEYVNQEGLLIVLGHVIMNLGERFLGHSMQRPYLNVDSIAVRECSPYIRHVVGQLRAVVVYHLYELRTPHKHLVWNLGCLEWKVL